jgi:hypothetical protein
MSPEAMTRCGFESGEVDDFAPRSFLITLPDGFTVDLGWKNVQRLTREYFDGPAGLPPQAQQAAAFGRCSICPERDEPGHCHALEPLLPLLSVFDDLPSFTPVQVWLLESGGRPPVQMATTLQDALAVTCLISLLGYCGVGKRHRRYFNGARPMMKGREMAAILLANIKWEAQGDPELIDQAITRFEAEIRTVILCQVDRMRCVAPSDAFLNAYVEAHMPALLLTMHPKRSDRRPLPAR